MNTEKKDSQVSGCKTTRQITICYSSISAFTFCLVMSEIECSSEIFGWNLTTMKECAGFKKKTEGFEVKVSEAIGMSLKSRLGIPFCQWKILWRVKYPTSWGFAISCTINTSLSGLTPKGARQQFAATPLTLAGVRVLTRGVGRVSDTPYLSKLISSSFFCDVPQVSYFQRMKPPNHFKSTFSVSCSKIPTTFTLALQSSKSLPRSSMNNLRVSSMPTTSSPMQRTGVLLLKTTRSLWTFLLKLPRPRPRPQARPNRLKLYGQLFEK